MLKPHAPALLPEPPGRSVGGVVFLGLSAVLAVMACLKYLALHSTVFDLGVFLSNLYSLHEAGQWWRAFLGHAQPLLPVYAQVYRLVPDQAAPLLLLTVQALALALPALWAGRRYGLLAALAYALYFPVWTNALFDFHLDHLLIPILFGFLAAATSGRWRLAVIFGLLPALVKEPHALTTVACGLYLWLVAGRSRAGWGLMLFGGLYFYAATVWVIPFCTVDAGLGAESGAYAWLGGGPGEAIRTCLTQPGRVLAQMFGVPGKWKYLALLFGGLLFFPFFRPKLLLPALPALALPLLSAQPNYYGWANHYTAGAAGVLFFAFCEVLGPVRILARQSGAGARPVVLAIFLALALCHVLLAPSPVSRLFLATDNFAFSVEAYEPTARDAAILSEILRSVPGDRNVAVVSQNTLNWGALAERRDYNSFPLGVFAPHPVRDLSGATWKDFWTFVRTGTTPDLPVRRWQAGYVLLDLTRPWFVLDRGCDFTGGACRDEATAREFTDLVARARQELETVYDQGGFLILRRPELAVPVPAPQAGPAPEASDRPAGAAGDPAAPGSPVQAGPAAPATPASGTPGYPAATPAAPGAPPVVAPAPAQGEAAPDDAIEVEELDRFPAQRHGKKPMPVIEQPARPQEAGPDVAPAKEAPQRPARQPRRPRESAEQPAAAPGETTSPQETRDADANPAPDAGQPQDAPRRPARQPRRAKPATEQPAATPDGATPAQGTPDAGAALAPDGAPAAETPKRPARPRRQKEPAETIPASQPAQGGDNVPTP